MTYIPAVLAIIFGAFLIICLFIILNLYKKLLWHEKYLFNLDNKLLNVFKTMKRIDQKEMFESDDEVGRLWTIIKEIILELESQLTR